MLLSDPVYTPTIKTAGRSPTSITVSWDLPPASIREYVNYYTVSRIKLDGSLVNTTVVSDAQSHPYYMWGGLKPATKYYFKVSCEPGFIPQKLY